MIIVALKISFANYFHRSTCETMTVNTHEIQYFVKSIVPVTKTLIYNIAFVLVNHTNPDIKRSVTRDREDYLGKLGSTIV